MPTDDLTAGQAAPPTDSEGRTLVRSTIQPDVELWVTDAELLDLERAGILLDSAKPRPEDAGAAPARRKTAESKEA